jgi:hypothetical protein
MPCKLHITTSLRKKSGRVAIKIKDNGPGVPEDIRGRIFEPLFTTKAVGTGTGIGLALCHRLVETHGGSIRIEGPADQGAVFVVQLPIGSGAPEAAAQCQPRPAEGPGHRILIIDDEPGVAEFLADVLEYEGHQVALSVTGEETLRLLESQSFDIILSDIRMPEIGSRSSSKAPAGPSWRSRSRPPKSASWWRVLRRAADPRHLRQARRARSGGTGGCGHAMTAFRSIADFFG